jgi:succinoglycan biosynthesis transport protein ExoP
MNSRVAPIDVSSYSRSRRMSRSEDADSVDVRGLLCAVLRRSWLIAVCGFGSAILVYFVVGLLPPVYYAAAKVMLDPRRVQIMPAQEVVSKLELSEPVILGEIALLRSNVLIGDLIRNIGVERLETHFFEAPRTEVLERTRIADLVWSIRRDLKIFRESDSYVIVIAVEGGDPSLVMELANGIADIYIATQLAGRRETARQATAWIKEQVEELRIEVERAEAAVADFRTVRLERDGGSFDTATQQLANLSSQLVAARAERVAAEARYEQLNTLVREQGYGALARAVTSPLVERLNSDRLDLSREDAVWARDFGPDHPQRRRFAEEIDRIDTELEQEALRIIELRRNEAEVARLREASLEQGIQDLEERTAEISSNALGLRQLQREAEAARRNYEMLLARLSETRSQEELQQPDAKLIERATYPEVPSAPRPKLMGALGGVLGGTLGIALALLFEMTRPTYRSRSELEAETELPVLASLPRSPRKDFAEIIRGLRRNSNTMFGERIRHLRTVLLMQNGRAGTRAILVASSQPNEGKSLTAMALAEMAALAGKSVILVDGDLRRSRLAKSFGWEMRCDLANFILQDCDLAEAIHTDETLGLDVLCPARPCPAAADKLAARWLEPVISELKRVYDLVIIDSAPILKVADALVLARVADSIVYVVRWDATGRAAVIEGLDTLAEMRLGVTGLVLNDVDPKMARETYGEGYTLHD